MNIHSLEVSVHMPRSKQANQEIREKTKKQILEAARNAFIKKGLSVTIADIASEANISQGLAYRYFPKKEDIFLTLLEQSLQSRNSIELMIKDLQGSPIERLYTIVLGLVRHRYKNPEFYQFFYQALKNENLSHILQEKVKVHGQVLYEILIQLITEGQQKGEIAKDDPKLLVQIILTYLNGISAFSSTNNENNYVSMTEILMRMFKSN